MFQFQYGAIISLTFLLADQKSTLFQFQYGAIISILILNFFGFNIFVSIPIWCDYKYSSRNTFFILVKFQFQYGAIISCFSFRLLLALFKFQFQYGAIIS